MKSVNRGVCSGHSVEIVCNEVIDVERTIEHSADKPWNIRATLEASKGSSLPNSACHELEWPGANFMTRCSNTDDARYSPTTVAALQCGSHDIHISRAVETVVDTPIGHGSGNMFLNRDIKFFWINTIGGAQLFGNFELLGVDIDGDDFGGPGHFGALNDGKANCPKTKHGNGRVRLNLASIPDGSKTRRNSASEEAGLSEVSFLVDFGARNLSDDGVLAHGTASHKVENIFSFRVFESHGSVRHDPLSLGASDLGAEVGLWTLAKDASRFAALGRVAWNHVVADFDAGNSLSDRLHNTAGLVSENAGEESFGVVAIESVDIGMAQGIRDNFHTNFAGLGRQHGDFLFHQGLFGGTGHHGLALDW
mmetsp:Transcript_3536/g.8437  ORF Transcript_3536/g.8437 Transcript_3536/m.8437 type:complete len:365 (+) Transcript_3536:219-1313(+)